VDLSPYEYATISGPVNFTVNGQNKRDNSDVAAVEFHDNSSAGTASFVCQPGQVGGAGSGNVFFFDSASAGTGQFICNGAQVRDAHGGEITFEDSSSAGNGIFTLNAGALYFGGIVTFTGSATADHGTFTMNGGDHPSVISFQDTSVAGNATFIVNGSDTKDTGGAELAFRDDSTPGNSSIVINSGERGGGRCVLANPVMTGAASVSVFGNGTSTGNGELLISLLSGQTVSIGSLEGSGYVELNHGALLIGTNNRSTEFDGLILDSGSWTKVGTGTLTLTVANTYTGVTTVLSGTLKVNNTAGSGTGTAAVKVSGGTLGGRGIISGKVTVGTGGGTLAAIAPSQGASNPTTITLQNLLTFKRNGRYLYRLNTNKSTADQVIANGVTIDSRAPFAVMAVGNKKLTIGEVFTPISNTAASPINGTFANLADGSTVTVGVNKLQASYSGGDGNDLTLTVVP
jgi:autotransporter-associated beta strand protein